MLPAVEFLLGGSSANAPQDELQAKRGKPRQPLEQPAITVLETVEGVLGGGSANAPTSKEEAERAETRRSYGSQAGNIVTLAAPLGKGPATRAGLLPRRPASASGRKEERGNSKAFRVHNRFWISIAADIS